MDSKTYQIRKDNGTHWNGHNQCWGPECAATVYDLDDLPVIEGLVREEYYIGDPGALDIRYYLEDEDYVVAVAWVEVVR